MALSLTEVAPQLHIIVSSGLAFSSEMIEAKQLLILAAQALYQASQHGRNRTSIALICYAAVFVSNTAALNHSV